MKITRSSEHCMPNLTPMKPWAFINAKKFPPVDRCAQQPQDETEYAENSFIQSRNIEEEDYKYIFPKGSDGLASFSKKVRPKPFEDRVSVDEVDLVIRDKVKNDRNSLLELFKEADVHGKGFITKEALLRIIFSICGNVQVDHFYKLLERYDLNRKSVITFHEFEKAFGEPPNGNFAAPEIFHGMGHPYKVTSAFGLHLFREAALDKDFDLKTILPPSCFEKCKIILMPQLREALLRIKIKFCDEDFIRFWNKLDKNGVGSIPLRRLLEVLNLQDDGTPMCGIRHAAVPLKRPKMERVLRPKCPLKYTNCYKLNNQAKELDIHAGGVSFPLIDIPCWRPHGPGGSNEYQFGRGSQFADGLDFVRARRPRFASIMNTLQYIFEEPYQNMKIIFQKYDTKKTGFVPICTGLKILCEYDFSAELANLEKFLILHGAYDVNNGMNYKKLLDNFQKKGAGTCVNRSIAQIIVAQGQASGISSLNTMSVEEIERKLYETLHKDFLAFQTMLQKCSPDSRLILDRNLRKAIEKVLGYAMTEDQWYELEASFDYDYEIGDNDNRLVDFRKFLEKFDKPTGICRFRTDPALDEKSELWKKRYQKGTDVYDPPRNSAVICRLVADTLKKRFHQIDKQYKTFLDSSKCSLTRDVLMELLNSQGCRLTPQEMQVIWAVVEVMPNYSSWHYRQILKHLMANLYRRAAEFAVEARRAKLAAMDDQNMKVLFEFKKAHKDDKANKLSAASHKIEMALQSKAFQSDPAIVSATVDKMLPHMKDVWKSFKKQVWKIDIMGTATLELYEMKDLLNRNQFNLTKNEMNHILFAYDTKRIGRFDYIEFLTDFTRRNLSDPQAKPDLHFDRVRHNLLNKKTGKSITVTDTYKAMREYLLKRWKSLVRAYRKIDTEKTGRINFDQLNGVLLECGIKLNKDDLYHLFTGFDTNLDGKIDYIEFVEPLLNVFIPSS